MIVNIQRRINLLHHAQLHDHDAVRQSHGLGLVVGYVNNGKAVFLLQFLNLKAHLFPQMGIQAGQRFVQQHHIRVNSQGPGQGYPLLAAAGQEIRTFVSRVQQVGGL